MRIESYKVSNQSAQKVWTRPAREKRLKWLRGVEVSGESVNFSQEISAIQHDFTAGAVVEEERIKKEGGIARRGLSPIQSTSVIPPVDS